MTALGAGYRAGVKETAFSGVCDIVAELTKLGARPLVNDPMYTQAEIESLGFEDYEFGDDVDTVIVIVIVQANHEEYRRLRAESLPGVRTIVDGRGIVSQSLRDIIPTCTLGSASA